MTVAAFRALEPKSEGEADYVRLSRLVIDVGTVIVQGKFDSIHNPSILPRILQNHKTDLEFLKRIRDISPSQLGILFPSDTTYGESKNFDLTLLLILLRKMCNLTKPAQGWEALPIDNDLSLEADLARIQYFRNMTFANISKMKLTKHEFNKFWPRIQAALLRIVQDYSPESVNHWKKEIEKRRTGPISSQDITALLNQMPALVIQCVFKLRGFVGDATVRLWDQLKDDVDQKLLAVVQNVIFPTSDIIVENIYYGSGINIQLRVKTTEALYAFWERFFLQWFLRDQLKQVLITDEIKKLNGKHIEMVATISKEQYQDAQSFFHELTRHRHKEVEEVTERLDKLSVGIVHGYPIVDQGNTFQAHLARISSKDQIQEVLHHIKQDPKYSEATNIVWAYTYRYYYEANHIEDSDDGGEDLAGTRLQHLLRHIYASNVVVVVTCWQGDVYLHMDVYKHINERALELLLSHDIAGTCFQTCFQEIPKLLEKFEFEFERQKCKMAKKAHKLVKLTREAEAERQEPADFDIIHSEVITDRKSTFQAHIAHVTSKDQVKQVLAKLKEDSKIAEATYNMYAFKIYVKDKKRYLELGHYDDDLNEAGKKLSGLLHATKVEEVVVIVTHWYGGLPLGPERFKHINTCASEVIKMGLDRGLISSQSSSSGAEQVQTKQKKGKGKGKNKRKDDGKDWLDF